MAWTERYMDAAADAGGDGTTNATTGANCAWNNLTDAAAGVASGQRVNVKAGTYAHTTTTVTLATAGTTSAPIWWRGYKTTIGDLDDGTAARVAGTDLPAITFSTGQLVLSAGYQIFSGLDITSACVTAGGAVSITGGNIVFYCSRIENTANHANASAVKTATTGAVSFIACRLKAYKGASAAAVIAPNVGTLLFGCHVIGGTSGISGTNNPVAHFCVIEGFNTSGMVSPDTGYSATSFQNTIYSNGATYGIRFINPPATGIAGHIVNTIIGGVTNGIHSGSATSAIRMFNVQFYSCTNNLVNVAEIGTYDADLGKLLRLSVTASDPWVAKASNDFTLASGAAAKSAGFPGIFEGQTAMHGYPDIGAVRHIDPSAGGLLNGPGMNGGLNG